jgi:hypothetical protein
MLHRYSSGTDARHCRLMSAFLGVDRFGKSGHASAGRRYFDDGDPVFAAIAIKLDSGGPVIFRSAVFLSAAICVGSRPSLSRPTRLP